MGSISEYMCDQDRAVKVLKHCVSKLHLMFKSKAFTFFRIIVKYCTEECLCTDSLIYCPCEKEASIYS